jgi:hypothetical protein
MMQRMQSPCRMRLAWESRCRMVGLVLEGALPGPYLAGIAAGEHVHSETTLR